MIHVGIPGAGDIGETDGTPICDGREGRRSVALARAVYGSSRAGREVRLD